MNIEITARAQRDYAGLSSTLQSRVRKQITLLQSNLRHPSLQAKKYDDGNDIWQGRVNRDYRFYFQIVVDTYRILRIIPHPK
jgi:mRNA-degrading endonuclease RelE of RelBE toxin-antitoxin system